MIKPRKLIWQIFPASVLTILLAVTAVSWYGAGAVQKFHLKQTEKDLEARAILLKTRAVDYIAESRFDELRTYCVVAGRESGTRITIIQADGKVLADSNEDPEVMDNHRMRIEIDTAFWGEVGVSRRFSRTLGENLLYVALPVRIGESGMVGGSVLPVSHVLRTSISVASLDRTLENIKRRIAWVAMAVVLFAGLVTLLISKNISKPLELMTKSADQFARGDFSQRRLPKPKLVASSEIVTLADSMDRMAGLLDEKIQAIVTHRNQLETVFSSMVEAVIAIDTEERVISTNDAAAELFNIKKATAPGKLVQQIVRNIKLQEKISHTLSTKETVESEILLHENQGDRFLQTHVVSLTNGVGEHVGVLVVMNDVTKLRRLENVRRDFVANVSHELRTPITSIRGYVETLLDGALDIREDAVRFLEIVLRQSQRLTTIIDDLLSLSRIEEEARQGQIVLERDKLLPVIVSVVETCVMQARQRDVELDYNCPEDLSVQMNPTLLEQALVNLMVNGITYTRPGGRVSIDVVEDFGEEADKVAITVRDNGCGIAKEHLPRLFERFYRSDKARSRALGGTGLGLAIVKHIAQAHNGKVEVQSLEGEGSEFTLLINT